MPTNPRPSGQEVAIVLAEKLGFSLTPINSEHVLIQGGVQSWR
jgi:hypothetical protein